MDVFAFGMVIYELLCLQAPFATIDVPKRNTLVMNGKRPKKSSKAMWAPLMAQDIMTSCWSHDPEKRPSMKEVTEWVATEEFRRLRAEISIDEVESVSCACVCRITMEDKQEDDEVKPITNGIGHVDVESSIRSTLRLEAGGFGRYPDVDPTRLQYETPSFNTGRNILPPVRQGRGTLVADGSGENFDVIDGKQRERSSYQRQFSNEAYTQVWVCDKKDRGGLLEIFSYCDTQPSYLVRNWYTISYICKGAALNQSRVSISVLTPNYPKVYVYNRNI